MTKPAAIAAQLVDVRNVNTHKCVRLIIDVPAEQAMTVMEAFGWPTQVNPVPVAIARLDLSKVSSAGIAPQQSRSDGSAADLCGGPPDRPHTPRKPVAAEKRLANEAGRLCAEGAFRKFLSEQFPDLWSEYNDSDEQAAAGIVRSYCTVQSRAEIVPGSPAAERWIDLRGKFEAWRIAA